MAELPSGTVTFLFTDIEGSTRLWEEHPEAMRVALPRHDQILRQAISEHRGVLFSTGGDGFAAAFPRAADALGAAIEAQLQLAVETWPDETTLRVRMGVHTGAADERGGDYFGTEVNRAARLMAVAHGGQVVCSAVSVSLAPGHLLPAGASYRDLGEHRLRDLSEPERVTQVLHERLAMEFPPLRTLDRYPGNLPIQPTAFIGRESELREVIKALEESKVVTLSGVGGVGKTRLALQVAAELVPRFSHGAWLVELAGVGSDDGFEEAVAMALGIQQRPGTPIGQTVLDYLEEKTLLLVLDNCEHLLDPAARFVESAIRAAPALRVLTTSREGLAIPGERVTTVPSLDLPDAGMPADAALSTDAVRLFVERAKEASSGFVLDDAKVGSIIELCRRLDGIPLAIELAAARVKAMTPAEITEHLDHRFKLLSRGRRTATTRHQTLQNTIDWSYGLLEDSERVMLRRLAVFAGGFDIRGAEAVVAGEDLVAFEVLELVARLVEKSLVVAEDRLGQTRYRLLETIRDYAWDRLEETNEIDPVAERHARHFFQFACGVGRWQPGRDEIVWRAQIEQELDNLRAALRWAITADDADLALQMISALDDFDAFRTSLFGMMAEEAILMPGAEDHSDRAVALGSLCRTLTRQGEIDRALEFGDLAEQAVDALPDSPQRARARCQVLSGLSTALAYQGDSGRLLELGRKALVGARAIGDGFYECQALLCVSGTLPEGNEEEALALGEQAVAIAHAQGSPTFIGLASAVLAQTLASRDPARSERLCLDAIEAATKADNDWALAIIEQALGTVQAMQGNFETSARMLIDLTDRASARGDRLLARTTLLYLAPSLAAAGDHEAALIIGAWVEQLGYLALANAASGLTARYVAYAELRKAQSAAERERIQAIANTLDEFAIFEYARRQVGALGVDQAKGHDPVELGPSQEKADG